MGWNTTALFVRGRSIDELIDTLPDVVDYVPQDVPVSAEQATSGSPGDRIYLAETAEWCQLWDPDARIAGSAVGWLDSGELQSLKGTQALAVVFSSVTSMYGFWLLDDGRLTRHVLYENGDPAESFGERLPIEGRIDIPSWGPDEDFLWSVVKDVTGLGYDNNRRYHCYEIEAF